MADTDSWLTEFGNHQGRTGNPSLYWLALLALLLGTVGLLWSLPVPNEFADISPLLNWGSVFLMATLVYYFIISISLAVGMVPFILGVSVFQWWLAEQLTVPGCGACVLTGIGVAGLSFVRYTAGGTRAVMRDIQLVMIAPVWLLYILYRRLGIPV